MSSESGDLKEAEHGCMEMHTQVSDLKQASIVDMAVYKQVPEMWYSLSRPLQGFDKSLMKSKTVSIRPSYPGLTTYQEVIN